MRRRFALILALFAAACTTTGPLDLAGQRARWSSFQIHSYTYVFEQVGLFNAVSGHQVRVTVVADTVAQVRDANTGDTLPWPPSFFPTINKLFDEAEASRQAGALGTVTYDPTWAYPTRIDLIGLADASGTLFASGLEAPGICTVSGAWGWDMNFNPGGSYLDLFLVVTGDSVTGGGVERGIGPNGTLDSITVSGKFLQTLAPPLTIGMTLSYRSGRVVHYTPALSCPDMLSGTATEPGTSYQLVLIKGRTVN